jgi:hypothetical protein
LTIPRENRVRKSNSLFVVLGLIRGDEETSAEVDPLPIGL